MENVIQIPNAFHLWDRKQDAQIMYVGVEMGHRFWGVDVTHPSH